MRGGVSSSIRFYLGNRPQVPSFLAARCDRYKVNDALSDLPQNSVSFSAQYRNSEIVSDYFYIITESSGLFSLFQTADDLVIGESYAFNTGLKDGDKFLFLGKERAVRVAENDYFHYALRYDAELPEKDIVSYYLQIYSPISEKSVKLLKTRFKKGIRI